MILSEDRDEVRPEVVTDGEASEEAPPAGRWGVATSDGGMAAAIALCPCPSQKDGGEGEGLGGCFFSDDGCSKQMGAGAFTR